MEINETNDDQSADWQGRLSTASKVAQTARDAAESALRDYLDDPCDHTRKRLARARWRLSEANDQQAEILEEIHETCSHDPLGVVGGW